MIKYKQHLDCGPGLGGLFQVYKPNHHLPSAWSIGGIYINIFKGHWTVPNGCRLLRELKRRHRNSIFNRFLLKTSFYCLLSCTFVTLLIHWPLSRAAPSVSWCRSCFVYYEIYSRGGPSMYIYCVVCYRVIAAPYIRVLLHTVTLLLTIQNTQWTMRSLYSLMSLTLPDLLIIGINWISYWQLLTMLVKGKQTCHTKVSTIDSLNKVWDTQFVLMIPVIQYSRPSEEVIVELQIMWEFIKRIKARIYT